MASREGGNSVASFDAVPIFCTESPVLMVRVGVVVMKIQGREMPRLESLASTVYHKPQCPPIVIRQSSNVKNANKTAPSAGHYG